MYNLLRCSPFTPISPCIDPVGKKNIYLWGLNVSLDITIVLLYNNEEYLQQNSTGKKALCMMQIGNCPHLLQGLYELFLTFSKYLYN